MEIDIPPISSDVVDALMNGLDEPRVVRRSKKSRRKRSQVEPTGLGEFVILSAHPLESRLWELHLQSRTNPTRSMDVIAFAGEDTAPRKDLVVDVYRFTTTSSIVYKVV